MQLLAQSLYDPARVAYDTWDILCGLCIIGILDLITGSVLTRSCGRYKLGAVGHLPFATDTVRLQR